MCKAQDIRILASILGHFNGIMGGCKHLYNYYFISKSPVTVPKDSSNTSLNFCVCLL